VRGESVVGEGNVVQGVCAEQSIPNDMFNQTEHGMEIQIDYGIRGNSYNTEFKFIHASSSKCIPFVVDYDSLCSFFLHS